MRHTSVKNKLLKKMGVIGYPINHSKSPLMHNTLIAQYKLNAHYQSYAIEDDSELTKFINQVKSSDWIGFNITIPYKQKILPFLDVIDSKVTDIHACNTVVVNDNKLYGYNTDAEGFYYPLKNKLVSSAMVLGNGGAARAVLYQLCLEGVVNICLVARDHLKSDDYIIKLNKQFQINIRQITFEELNGDGSMVNEYNLIINTTSIGMNPEDQVPSFIDFIKSNQIFYDLIYNPWETKMIQACKKSSANVINGAPMLAHQGALAFELFFNQLPNTSQLIELLKRDQL